MQGWWYDYHHPRKEEGALEVLLDVLYVVALAVPSLLVEHVVEEQ
jgi:hypothetical protein